MYEIILFIWDLLGKMPIMHRD